ncbi:MAG: hypothetical protein HY744_18305 [Deltaproteobacteria bacterium]|nr:hypothetical protein [Deltaproteobacteria bacterium]
MSAARPARAEPGSGSPPDPWSGPDKALHFVAGFGLSAGGYAIGAAAFDDRLAATALGTGFALGLGAAKEGIDAAGAGTPSYRDFTWTVLGACLGIGVSLTFDFALRGPASAR